MENGLVSDVKRVSDYKELENKILYDNHRDNSLKGILEESKLSNKTLEEIKIIANSNSFI